MTLPALQNSSVFYRKILSRFPQDISLAFAYGSAVFRQTGSSQGQMGKNMLDFVFAVDDPVTWHTMNLIENRKHYSFLKFLGPKHISSIQNDYGAGVYFNTLVSAEDRVRILLQNENGKLRAALVRNLKRDFRMVIGEDKSKVSNIVKDNMPHFRKLYNNILQECPQVVYKPQQGRLEVDKSPEGQFTQLMALPCTLQQQITRLVDRPGKNRDVEEILLQVAQDPDCGSVVQQGISSIVKSSSITQSAKGIATAGLVKTVSYSAKKLQKMWRGWRRKPS
ncbi:Phosphatidate cytidylyltransferase, mitochondrial [Labeo rohita]|uniref:Phosphatidate cytidylyltransferase, mitochondrial n=1 Tax=Labeo rohita TaxID=84645 RepID=A0ABQ8M9Y5_LABRO|nr:Phosphatidate cytidylyltransferase, mitochondrial [Labeo rohita]